MVVGIIVGAVLALCAVLVLAVPAVLVVVLTRRSAVRPAVVNGALILLGLIKLEDVDQGLMEGLLKYGIVAIVGLGRRRRGRHLVPVP